MRFKSIVDGSDVRLTPERAMQVQNQLGADIIMAFDDCPPSVAEAEGEKAASDHPETSETDPRLVKAQRRDTGKKRRYDHAQRLKIARPHVLAIFNKKPKRRNDTRRGLGEDNPEFTCNARSKA